MLSPDGCRRRQARLLQSMEAAGLDLFISANYRTVYYLTGSLSSPDAPTAVALQADGRSALVTSVAGVPVADTVLPVGTYSIHRVIDQPVRDAVTTLRGYLSGIGPVRTCGVESSATPVLVGQMLCDIWPKVELRDAGPEILRLRKRKEEDEIVEIGESLALIAAAYDAARATIAVGRTELDVYNAMQSAVVQKAGTFVQLNGDFAVGTRAIRGGGPPTGRVIEPGDLYILDLFPAPALYFGDTCRTFAVTEPTDLHLRAWEAVCAAVSMAERAVRPGVRAADVYAEVKAFLDLQPFAESSFWHHLGHGIGHHGHEAPRIIPGSADIFEIGDVFTLEPGIYTTPLQGGIRLEDNYVVREGGLENLFNYPREL